MMAISPKISEAWSHGLKLSYFKQDRRYVGCETATGCLREEVGYIILSQDMFVLLAETGGLKFQLSGPRGQYAGTLPASAFAEVLRRVAEPASGPTRLAVAPIAVLWLKNPRRCGS